MFFFMFLSFKNNYKNHPRDLQTLWPSIVGFFLTKSRGTSTNQENTKRTRSLLTCPSLFCVGKGPNGRGVLGPEIQS